MAGKAVRGVQRAASHVHELVLATFVVALLCIAHGCAGASSFSESLVAHSTVDGTGDVRSDGNVTIAMGEISGELGLSMKGSGFPLLVPFTVEKGHVFVSNRRLKVARTQAIAEPLPAWCEPLYRPGEVAALGEKLGESITFEPADPTPDEPSIP